MSNKFKGQRFCVYIFWVFKKGNRFARTVFWRVPKPIGNVKVNVRTVKHWYFNYVKHDFHFLVTNNCPQPPFIFLISFHFLQGQNVLRK